MKLSLWAWALYWPGGGLLLLLGGFQPAILVVTLASFAAFVALLWTGALRADSSRSMKEFVLERPLYLVLALVVLALAAPLLSIVANVGFALFSAVYLASLVLVAVRLWQHLQATGQGVLASKADQTFIALGLVGISTFLIFADAWGSILFGAWIGGTAMSVATVNWVNLLYPPLMLVATRPFREPLQWPQRRRTPSQTPAPTAAPTAGEAVAAKET